MKYQSSAFRNDTITLTIFDILKLLFGSTIRDGACKISLWKNIHPVIEPEPELSEQEKKEHEQHRKETMKIILKDDIKKVLGIPKQLAKAAARQYIKTLKDVVERKI